MPPRHRDPPPRETEEPIEVVEERPGPAPSPPLRTPQWPASGEGWKADRPLPSRHEEPITGRGPESSPIPLQPSRPERPVTEKEQKLNRRRVITSVIIYGDEAARDLSETPRPRPMPVSLSPSGRQRYGNISAMIEEIAMELQDEEEEEDSGGPSVDTGTEVPPARETPPVPLNEEEVQQSGAPIEGGPPNETH